jgi:signal transduction histidine kinase
MSVFTSTPAMASDSKVDKRKSAIRIFHNAVTAWVVLLFGFAFTGAAWYTSNQFVNANAEARFENRVTEITAAIHQRMFIYEQVLWGGVGFFNAVENVDRKVWRDYVDALKLEQHWPGIQGIGFSVPVTPEEKGSHIAAIRDEGFPQYTIKPAGQRDAYSAIIYLEPFDWRNKRAFGYDMWSNDMRRQAMTRARDTGEASTSGIITLVQETQEDVQRGFLTYVPLYKKGMPVGTVAQRRAAFEGWVYSPFRMGNLMKGVLGANRSDVEYEIFDGADMNADTLLFDSNKSLHADGPSNDDALKKIKTLELQGRTWLLVFSSGSSELTDAEKHQPTFVAIAGLVVDFLLFHIISSLAYLQRRAEGMATAMTSDLRTTQTELEAKVAELSASNEELAQFAYISSHDLQEPLRMVASYCDLLKEDYGDKLDNTGREYLDFAVDGAQRMRALITDLLTYSKIGQKDLELSRVSVDEVLGLTLKNLEMAISENGAEVTHGPLPSLTCDPGQLGQLFLNLIGNGIKFKGDAPPRIHVSAERDGDEWTFAFADNGIGIDQAYAEQVFTMFQRLHTRTTYDGNGIGLSVCRKIAERHRGKIGIEPNVGGGSIFYVSLPEGGTS